MLRQDRLGRKNEHESSGAVDKVGERTSGDGGSQNPEVHPPPEPRQVTAASLLGRLRKGIWSGPT